jgi:hypothetical protein
MDIGSTIKLIFNTLPECVCIDSNGDYVEINRVYEWHEEDENIYSNIYVNTTPHFLNIYYESELGKIYDLGYIDNIREKTDPEMYIEIKKLYLKRFKTTHGIKDRDSMAIRTLNLGELPYKNK